MSKKQEVYENHLDEQEARWFAVYTPFKREKLALRHLERKGIKAYLPIQRLVRIYTRKKRIVELPLISCYVFVKITKSEYVSVLETEHILNFVRFSKNLLAIPEQEIKWMQRVLGEGLEVNVEQGNFNEGDAVEIVSGNLVGLKGRLVEKRSKSEFLLDLKSLGYTLRMIVKPEVLMKIDKPIHTR